MTALEEVPSTNKTLKTKDPPRKTLYLTPRSKAHREAPTDPLAHVSLPRFLRPSVSNLPKKCMEAVI